MSKVEKAQAPRYSAAELYGRDMETLAPEELRVLSGDSGTHLCPFRSQAYGKNLPCNKRGGVCSIRPYVRLGDDEATLTGIPTVTCPNRFLEQGTVHKWVGETLLSTSTPALVPELPFLMGGADELDGIDAVGKIDMVLVNTVTRPPSWCPLEMQAVYFSGMSMENDRRIWSTWAKKNPPYPPVNRRPDFRSSGPKRLMPQLQIKVPTIARWGKKMAVVIDSEFWKSLGGMRQTSALSNCDIAWFVVRLERKPDEAELHLTPDGVHFTTLANAVEGLTGGSPVSLERFEQSLWEKLVRLGAI